MNHAIPAKDHTIPDHSHRCHVCGKPRDALPGGIAMNLVATLAFDVVRAWWCGDCAPYYFGRRFIGWADDDLPWNRWREEALRTGVRPDVAELGCNLMQAANRQLWPREVQARCGWADHGRGLLALALADPERAVREWTALLLSDAGREPAPQPAVSVHPSVARA